MPRYFPAAASHSPEQSFDSKKISLRIFRRHGREKRAIAATNIDFERLRLWKKLPEWEGGTIIRRHNFDRRGRRPEFLRITHSLSFFARIIGGRENNFLE